MCSSLFIPYSSNLEKLPKFMWQFGPAGSFVMFVSKKSCRKSPMRRGNGNCISSLRYLGYTSGKLVTWKGEIYAETVLM